MEGINIKYKTAAILKAALYKKIKLTVMKKLFILVALFASAYTGTASETELVTFVSKPEIKIAPQTSLQLVYNTQDIEDVNLSQRTSVIRLIYTRDNHTDLEGSNWEYKIQYTEENTNTTGYLTVSTGHFGDVYSAAEVIELGTGDNANIIINSITAKYQIDGNTTTISGNDVSSSTFIPDDINLELTLINKRVQTFNVTDAITINSVVNTTENRLHVFWTTVAGAEEYDLEYVYIDGDLTGWADPFLAKEPVRVRLKDNKYAMDMVYPIGGDIYFRVRGIGRFTDNPENYDKLKIGNWSNAFSPYNVSVNFEETKNWIYNITFAEEGKNKQVIDYADGLGRKQQSLTRLSTSDIVIAQTDRYDYEGRPAVSILPSPVSGKELKYRKRINQSTTTSGSLFDKKDFDKGISNPVDDANGAGKYFSPQNDFTSDPYRNYIPDAAGYVYSQTKFTRDNTGRPSSVSGLGKEHKIHDANDTQPTHESKYYYTSPGENQLIKLFGSNLGDISHYKKTIAKDPNGQLTASYIDQQDRTIATSLINNTTVNLEDIDNAPAAETTIEKLMTKNTIQKNGIKVISRSVDEVFNEFAPSPDINFTYNFSNGVINPGFVIESGFEGGDVDDFPTDYSSFISSEHVYEGNFALKASSIFSNQHLRIEVKEGDIIDISAMAYKEAPGSGAAIIVRITDINGVYLASYSGDDPSIHGAWELLTPATNYLIPLKSVLGLNPEDKIILDVQFWYASGVEKTWFDNFKLTIRNDDICYSCKYELEINAFKPDGSPCNLFYAGSSQPKVSTPIYNTVSDNSSYIPNIDHVDFYIDDPDQVGAYKIIKELRAVDYNWDFDAIYPHMPGYNSPGELQAQYAANVDYSNCSYTCEQHYQDYLLQNSLTDTQAERDAWMAQNCDVTQAEINNGCDILLENLKAQVSPGGVYFDNHSSSIWTTLWVYIMASDDEQSNAEVDAIVADYQNVNTWTESKANLLVQFHPEICHYNKCVDKQDFELYRFKMIEVVDWPADIYSDWLDPLNIVPDGSGYSNLTISDPISSHYELVNPSFPYNQYYEEFKYKIYNTFAVIDNTDDGIDNGISYNLVAYTDPAVSPEFYTNLSAALKTQRRWQLFRSLYDGEREKLLEKYLRLKHSCSYLHTDYAVAQPPFGDPPVYDGIPPEYDGSTETFDPVDFCNEKSKMQCAKIISYVGLNDDQSTEDYYGDITSFLYFICSASYDIDNPFGIITPEEILGSQPGDEIDELVSFMILHNLMATTDIEALKNAKAMSWLALIKNNCPALEGLLDTESDDATIMANVANVTAGFKGYMDSKIAPAPAYDINDYKYLLAFILCDGILQSDFSSTNTNFQDLFALLSSVGCSDVLNDYNTSQISSLGYNIDLLKVDFNIFVKLMLYMYQQTSGFNSTLEDVFLESEFVQNVVSQEEFNLYEYFYNSLKASIDMADYLGVDKLDLLGFEYSSFDLTGLLSPGNTICTCPDVNSNLKTFLNELEQGYTYEIIDIYNGVYRNLYKVKINNENNDVFNLEKNCINLNVNHNLTTNPYTYNLTIHPYDDCKDELDNEAYALAQQQYNMEYEDAHNAYLFNYQAQCMKGIQEKFYYTTETREYYHTLYYYDQAGNLVQTVQPEDVRTGKVAEGYFPSGEWDGTEPNYIMPVKYQFNSLNQPVAKESPDAGTSHLHYNNLQQLRFTQDARQLVAGLFTYFKYDNLGRTIETGEYDSDAITVQEINDPNFPTTGTSKITTTVYDQPSVIHNILDQQNLRGRISGVLYHETAAGSLTSASYYSYDVHGNVEHMVQYYNGLGYKHIRYEYDLISGNVTRVYYQENSDDRFIHKYEYDADNRLTNVYTCTLPVSKELLNSNSFWEQDAKYFYYLHGPLVRVELGNDKVQGQDYAYTLQGWLKGVNSNTLQASRDIGLDGSAFSNNLNKYSGQDAFGYSLGYYTGDYKPLSTPQDYFLAAKLDQTYNTSANDLFNGNISTMTTTIRDIGHIDYFKALPQLTQYRYDQLNRIKNMTIFENNDVVSSNNWLHNAQGNTQKYFSMYKYDFNGNLSSLYRYDDNETFMDELTYNYNVSITNPVDKLLNNRLNHVDDPFFLDKGDINTGQQTDNYQYDAIGNLISDASEEIANIEWTPAGKIKKITRIATSEKPDIEYGYNATGNRALKIVKIKVAGGALTDQSQWTYTYYVHDAQGNIMATYERWYTDNGGGNYTGHFSPSEYPIYGSSRIGVKKEDRNNLAEYTFTANIDNNPLSDTYKMFINLGMGDPVVGFPVTTLYSKAGNKAYELNNHLGNVLTTVSDKKYAVEEQPSINIFSSFEGGDGNQFRGGDYSVQVATDQYYSGTQSVKLTRPNANSDLQYGPTVWIKVYPGDVIDADIWGYMEYAYDAMLVVNLQNSNRQHVEKYDGTDWHVQWFANPIDNSSAWENMHYTYTVPEASLLSEDVDNLYIVVHGWIGTDNHEAWFDDMAVTITRGQSELVYHPDIISTDDYYPFGFPMPDRSQYSSDNKFGFHGQLKDNEIAQVNGAHLSYEFREHDTRLGRFWSVDPLAAKFPSESPYLFCGDNPIYYVDKNGQYKVPTGEEASYNKNYPTLVKYLAENVKQDVMNSPNIMAGLLKYSGGNLTDDKVSKATTWKSGPTIMVREDPGGMKGANGYYDSKTGTIELSTDLAKQLENASDDDKQAALFGLFVTLTHETVHYGDYLDNKRQEADDPSGFGGEPGSAFVREVFNSKTVVVDGNSYSVPQLYENDKIKDAKEMIEMNKDEGKSDVIPTVPTK